MTPAELEEQDPEFWRIRGICAGFPNNLRRRVYSWKGEALMYAKVLYFSCICVGFIQTSSYRESKNNYQVGILR
jgi:hypothetical protein